MRDATEIMLDLASAGLTPEQLALVMELTASLGSSPRADPVAEKRRAYDRERKRAKKLSTGIPPESAESAERVSPNEYISNPHPDPQIAKAIRTPLAEIGERVVTVWNEAIAGTPLPRALKMTSGRLKHLKARLAEHSEAEIGQAIRGMVASDWHSGRSGNWTEGSLGWLLKSPENFQKMLEKGEAAQAPAKPVTPEQRQSADLRTAAIYDRMGRSEEAAEIRRRCGTTGADGKPISSIIQQFRAA